MPLFQTTPSDVNDMKVKKNVNGLIKALDYKKNWLVRSEAAEALGEITDSRAIRALISALKDEEGRVCNAAMKALIKIGIPSVEPLIEALKDKDSSLKARAVEALGEIEDTRSVEPLIAALENKEFEKYAVVKSLGRIRDPRAVPHLISILPVYKYPIVIQALGLIGDKSAIETIINVLNEGSTEMRHAAVYALVDGNFVDSRTIGPLLHMLRRSEIDPLNDTLENAITLVLTRIGASSMEHLIASFRTFNVNGFIREFDAYANIVINILEKIGEPALLALLITSLKDDHPAVRKFAVKALVKMGGDRVVELLTPALVDEDCYVRMYVVNVLAVLGKRDGSSVDEHLIGMLKDKIEFVRMATVRALAEIGDPWTLGPLFSALNDQSESVRRSVLEGFGKFKDSSVVDHLIAVLKEPSTGGWNRQIAADSLGSVGDARAMEPLIAALNDKYWTVRDAAIKALVKIGNNNLAIEPLVHCLNDSVFEVSESATTALVSIGKPAVMPIIASLHGRDKSLAAINALRTIGDTRAIYPLIALLEDESSNYRHAAAYALDRLGWERTK